MLKKEPLVSVCMPCYNHEEFVGQAIQSVLSQTYSNFELIIVDDASADNSAEVIHSFEDSRIRVKVIEENTGFGAAEYMFRQARGEFVCWLDSDDIWEPTLLERYMEFFQGHKECGACFCRPIIIDGSGCILTEHLFCSIFSEENLKNMEKEKWFRKIFIEGNYLCSSTLCIRKNIYEQVGELRFQYKQVHDYDYWLRFLQVAEIYVLPDRLARYRIHWEGENANFSTPTSEVICRDEVERAYILLEVMEGVGEGFFIKAFSDLLCFSPEEEGFCLECEKFLMIEKSEVCPSLSAVFYYYRHYQDERFRYYCKNYYGITNNMIYEMAGNVNIGQSESLLSDSKPKQEKKPLTKDMVFNPWDKPIAVWGAGIRTEKIMKNGLINFPIECIIDREKKSLGAIKTILPDVIEDWKKCYVIVTPKKFEDEIFRILEEKGLQHGDDYIGYDEFCKFSSKIYKNKLFSDLNNECIATVIMPELPLGDMCAIIGFLKAYKEKMGKSLVFYALGEHGKEVLELCPYIERVEKIPIECMEYLEDTVREGKNNLLDMRTLLADEDKLDFLKVVKRILQLPEGIRYDRITPGISSDMEKVEKLFQSLGLREGKTIFIAPDTDLFGPLGKELKSIAFWTRLSEALAEEGYDAVFYSKEAVVPGIPYVFLELAELPRFIEMCGNVVGIRSGLLNFIAVFTDVAIQCFWPEDDSIYFNTDTWKNFAERGSLSQTDRSQEMIEAGLALTKEMNRTDKVFEFVCQNDWQDIETIIRNLRFI